MRKTAPPAPATKSARPILPLLSTVVPARPAAINADETSVPTRELRVKRGILNLLCESHPHGGYANSADPEGSVAWADIHSSRLTEGSGPRIRRRRARSWDLDVPDL